MTTLTGDALSLIRNADSYTDIFSDQSDIDVRYRELAKALHPDRFGDDGLVGKTRATEYFQKLVGFRDDAVRMAQEGRWGERPVLATITTRKAKHQIRRKLYDGDLTNVYAGTTMLADGRKQESLLKVAKSARDNDLVAQETRALKKLHEDQVDENGNSFRHVLVRHFPELRDTFLHSEGRRRTNVIEWHQGFYTLADVAQWWPDGLPPEHLAWVWRRLLQALGYAHDQGIVHGAVLPSHILIQPEDHGLLLIDWCYSVVIDSESKTNIKAVVPVYKQGYPEEVLNKEPPSPATDLYMAAQSMLWSSKRLPRKMQAFFNGTKLSKQSSRPQNAWLLLEEFDELLKTLGEPFYPRRFVPLIAPAV